MPRKRHSEIVAKLRQADVLLAQGQMGTDVARVLGVTETSCAMNCWRRHYNTIRPHSLLGYRPPAPEVSSCREPARL